MEQMGMDWGSKFRAPQPGDVEIQGHWTTFFGYHTIFWSDQNRGLPNSSIEMEHTDKSLDFVGVLCTIFGQNYSAPFQGELEDATVDSFIAVPEVYLDLLKDQVHRLKNGVQTFLEV